MESTEHIVAILAHGNRADLARLLRGCRYTLDESDRYGSRLFSRLTTVEIHAPVDKYGDLEKVSEEDRSDILRAFLALYPVRDNDVEITDIRFCVDREAPLPSALPELTIGPEPHPTYWRVDYFRLFISHSSDIKTTATELKEQLAQHAISGFVAHEDIEPIKEWLLVIEESLRTCDGFLALLSESFPGSKWTDQEVGIAIALNKLIIPVRMDCDPYGFMGKYQAVNGRNRTAQDIAADVFRVLIAKEQSRERMARATVEMFMASNSFQEAKDNVSRLEQIQYLDAEMARNLQDAVRSNGQIRNTFGVPSRVTSLIARFERNVRIQPSNPADRHR